jgi:hypothetical protein
MTAPPRPPTPRDEFLAWARAREGRDESDGAAPVARTGSTFARATIATNLVRALAERLRGAPRTAIRGNLEMVAASGCAIATRSWRARKSRTTRTSCRSRLSYSKHCREPPSTRRITKNAGHRATSSGVRRVMLEQARITAAMFPRQGERWIGEVFSGATTLAMPETGVELPFPACYAGLRMDGEDAS